MAQRLDAQTLDTEPLGLGEGSATPSAIDLSSIDPHGVDALLNHGFARLQFPQPLESLYRTSIAQQRLRTVIVSGVLASVLFNWLLLSDWMMIPDQFQWALRLRLFLFTPATLAGLLLLRQLNNPCHWEAMMVVGGISAGSITTALCVASHDPYAGPYLVSLSVIVVFASSVSRMRVRGALLLDGIMALMFAAGWASLPGAPVAIMAPAALTLGSSIVFTLYGAYCLEHDDRENWLLWVRERLLQSELRQANANLQAASESDMLTHLHSRHHFDLCLHAAWSQTHESGGALSLVMIDLDRFKQYNRRWGGQQGDDCLRSVATVLRSAFGCTGSLLARYSGQEFAIALQDTPLQRAVAMAEQARRELQAMRLVTASVGVSSVRPQAPHASAAQLIAAAEEALHVAKTRGGNRVVAFGTED